MEFFVDIADIEKVEAINEYFPIDGFTTNPVILTRAKKNPNELFPKYKSYLEKHPNQVIFVQVTATEAGEMLKQAKKVRKYFGSQLVIKIPVTKEGIKAIRLCKEEGIRVCVTVIHSTLQCLVAAKAGADYVAPYITHIDNIGADGILCVKETVDIFKKFGYDAKVLGASFRTADQILRLAEAGCPSVTITPEMFDSLIYHPSSAESLEGFVLKWKECFGDKEITDFLP